MANENRGRRRGRLEKVYLNLSVGFEGEGYMLGERRREMGGCGFEKNGAALCGSLGLTYFWIVFEE